MGQAQCRALPVRYYLLEEESEEGGSYGVEAELEGEREAILELSPSRQRVEALTETLLRGTVTPAGLRDVIDDWLLS